MPPFTPQPGTVALESLAVRDNAAAVDVPKQERGGGCKVYRCSNRQTEKEANDRFTTLQLGVSHAWEPYQRRLVDRDQSRRQREKNAKRQIECFGDVDLEEVWVGRGTPTALSRIGLQRQDPVLECVARRR